MISRGPREHPSYDYLEPAWLWVPRTTVFSTRRSQVVLRWT